MSAVAALLDGPSALHTLRRARTRGSPGGGGSVVSCRSVRGVIRVLEDRVTDVVVVGLRATELLDLDPLLSRFPGIPLLLYGAVRPDHAPALLALCQAGVAGILVEGVDDAAVGVLIHRYSLAGERERALAEAPRRLGLTEPLQQEVWTRLVRGADAPVRTTDLAVTMKRSREYLSRQFAAGGAPTLKQTMDLVRVATAAQLLRNPGYTVTRVARLLQFASPSHLGTMTRRVTGGGSADLGALGLPGVLHRFVRGR